MVLANYFQLSSLFEKYGSCIGNWCKKKNLHQEQWSKFFITINSIFTTWRGTCRISSINRIGGWLVKPYWVPCLEWFANWIPTKFRKYTLTMYVHAYILFQQRPKSTRKNAKNLFNQSLLSLQIGKYCPIHPPTLLLQRISDFDFVDRIEKHKMWLFKMMCFSSWRNISRKWTFQHTFSGVPLSKFPFKKSESNFFFGFASASIQNVPRL